MPNQTNPTNNSQDQVDDNPITHFVTMLMLETNMDRMPQAIQATYRENLEEEVHKRIGLKALEELPEENVDEYTKMMKDGASAEEFGDFFEQHIDNFEEKLKGWLMEFRDSFIDNFNKSKESLSNPQT